MSIASHFRDFPLSPVTVSRSFFTGIILILNLLKYLFYAFAVGKIHSSICRSLWIAVGRVFLSVVSAFSD